MTLKAYRNLTKEELKEADHYAETGNTAGLNRMKRLSAERETKSITLPLKMSERELDERINKGMNDQPKYACNSNFYLSRFDKAKLHPTAKALLLSLGLVELTDGDL